MIFIQLAGKLVPGHHSYIEHPTEKERIHCVVFVISAKTFSIMDEDVKKKLKDIREEADARSKLKYQKTYKISTLTYMYSGMFQSKEQTRVLHQGVTIYLDNISTNPNEQPCLLHMSCRFADKLAEKQTHTECKYNTVGADCFCA